MSGLVEFLNCKYEISLILSKRLPNCTFKVNFLCQKLSESFSIFFSLKNINLGAHFLVIDIFKSLSKMMPNYILIFLRATDGKIVNAQAMKVYFDLQDAYLEAGVTTEEDLEDLKLLEGDFAVI